MKQARKLVSDFFYCLKRGHTIRKAWQLAKVTL